MSKHSQVSLLPPANSEEPSAVAFGAEENTRLVAAGKSFLEDNSSENQFFQENSPEENPFAIMASELVIAFCTHLMPEDLFALIIVDRFFQEILNDNYLWCNKFKLHFPHLYPKYQNENVDSWYELFRSTYYDSYPELSEASRRIFSQIKERHFDSQLIELLHSSNPEPKDSDSFTFYDWIVQLAEQSFLNSLFAAVTEQQMASTGRTPLHWAVLYNQSQELILSLIKDLKVQDKAGDTPIALAIRANHLELVEFLWKAEMNLGQGIKNQQRLLALASFNNNEAVAKFLLDKGLSPKDKSETGIPPLFIAAQRGHLGLMRLFLSNNADIVNDTCSSNNASALYVAAENNNYEAVETLLDAKANVNLACKNGATPLHAAVANGNERMIKLLLNHGANLRAILTNDEEKLTVFDLANGSPGLMSLLNKEAETTKISSSPYILLAPPKSRFLEDDSEELMIAMSRMP
ncbi:MULTISPECIES: ankyrin repeat domain-containing protein [Legionella]|uniref:Ankyrin repeat protein n=1 Tax=Legionella drozanskii LLAP-1 TaxID=1212489 RepID=A0A0W0SVK1_9GAMM|nr:MULTISPECIES: ankyrin repeat domain-containing protein [Legionella]KTC87308.1 Ankyrin repeat protein [Legionella drozanskii LLAP-1]PJE17938.1 MAG: hypothetical protein CK430_01475 [Legionella sp.]